VGRRGDGVAPGLDRDDLAALLVAARAVEASGGLQERLQRVLDEAITLLGADEGSVMLLDDDRLRIAVARGIEAGVAARTVVPVGVGIAGHVAATGSPLLLNTPDALARYAAGTDRRRRLRSAACVPLLASGAVRGVLNVSVRRDDRADLDQRDVDLLALFAQFAAAAVRDATAVARAQRRSDELGELVEADHALAAANDTDEVAAAVVRAAHRLLDARATAVFDVRGGRCNLVTADGVARGWARVAANRDGFGALIAGAGLTLVDDALDHDILAPFAAGRSGMAIVTPLLLGMRHVGAVVVVTETPPSDERLRTWATFATHAAQSLSRALLFEEVAARQAEFASLIGAVPDPIIVLDADHRLLAVNPAAAETLELHPEFDRGLPVSERIRQAELIALLDESAPAERDIVLLLPEPHTFRARLATAGSGGDDGRAIILTLEDVTTVREIAQLKADFVAVIGHELRTPLTLVKGYSQALATRFDALPESARNAALTSLHDQTRKLEHLIEDLLLVSRIERHRPPLHLEDAEIVGVVRRAAAGAVAMHSNRNLEVDAPRHPVWARLDVSKVERIIHHLVDNACKFSNDGSAVTVAVREHPDRTEIEVSDRGIGIFSGDLPTLFDRFRQVDGSATRSYGGTGVGLYLCRTLTEAHGGQISVSSALGQGSTFAVELPRDLGELDARGDARGDAQWPPVSSTGSDGW
jgi:signal transduction histidine kinase